jgi:hypothetical protein
MWATGLRVLLGLLPFWLLLFELVAIRGSAELIGANPPAVAGLPLGMLFVVLALLVMALGVVVLARSSPVVALVGFIFLTVPATMLMIVGPAFALASLWGM